MNHACHHISRDELHHDLRVPMFSTKRNEPISLSELHEGPICVNGIIRLFFIGQNTGLECYFVPQ